MSIQNEADEIVKKHRKALKLDFDELLAKYRKYPNGFTFYFRGENDKPEECKILSAYLGFEQNNHILLDYSRFVIWYKCFSPYWCVEEDTYYPMTEDLVNRAIEKYGLHSPTTTKA
jgi:hypothetical protein